MHIKQSIEARIAVVLLSLTTLAGLILSNMSTGGTAVVDVSAANGTGTASITVADACSMAVSGNEGTVGEDGYTYSATVNNGSTQVVTANSIMVSCNDYAGFKIYAIGYSGDTLGGTDMIASTGEDYNIKTDASGTYGSYWKMKLTKANSIDTTIPSAYASYNVIPDDYVLVAQYASNTGNTASTASMITPSYQIYVGSAQPAGTYTGKVKYTLVHPTSAAAPEIPPDLITFTIAGTEYNAVKGMTWEEWVSSSYNEGGYQILNSIVILPYYRYYGIVSKSLCGGGIGGTDVIIAGQAYVIYSSGGGTCN